MPPLDDNLGERAGRLLRAARGRRLISQRRLAECAGTTQQWLSRVERGAVDLRLGDAERLFGALGLRLALEVSRPVDQADPDLVTDDEVEDRLDEAVTQCLLVWRRFADVPFVIAGRLAALAQGLPVRPTRLDLIVEESAVPAASSALDRLSPSRWNERHHEYLDFAPDLDAPGPRRWLVAGLHELRIDVMPTLPPTVPIVVAGQRLSLVRLADLLRVDPDVAGLRDRIGERARSVSTGACPPAPEVENGGL